MRWTICSGRNVIASTRCASHNSFASRSASSSSERKRRYQPGASFAVRRVVCRSSVDDVVSRGCCRRSTTSFARISARSRISCSPTSFARAREAVVSRARTAVSSSTTSGCSVRAPRLPARPRNVWASRAASSQRPPSSIARVLVSKSSKSRTKCRNRRTYSAWLPPACVTPTVVSRPSIAGSPTMASDAGHVDIDVVGPGRGTVPERWKRASVAYSNSGSIGLLMWPFMPRT